MSQTAPTPEPIAGVVTVIVVNWNGARLLGACLDAVEAQDYKSIETIVVDNASSDGSEGLAAARPRIRLMRNPSNVGFAAANNQALALARGEFVLLLNNDAILARDYVSVLVACMRDDPRRGSAVGKLVRSAQPAAATRLDSTGHVMFRNVQAWNRGENEPDDGRYNQPEEVFGVCAAAALYRRAMLADVAVRGEVLDSTFFAYLEDVDLDWRARLRGWSSWYEPRAIATHHRSASGALLSLSIQRHIFKNRILMLLKNDGGASLMWRLPGIIALTGAKLILGISHGPAFLSVLWQLVRLSPQAFAKRRIIQSRRTVQRSAIDRWFRGYPYLGKLRAAASRRAA